MNVYVDGEEKLEEVDLSQEDEDVLDAWAFLEGWGPVEAVGQFLAWMAAEGRKDPLVHELVQARENRRDAASRDSAQPEESPAR